MKNWNTCLVALLLLLAHPISSWSCTSSYNDPVDLRVKSKGCNFIIRFGEHVGFKVADKWEERRLDIGKVKRMALQCGFSDLEVTQIQDFLKRKMNVSEFDQGELESIQAEALRRKPCGNTIIERQGRWIAYSHPNASGLDEKHGTCISYDKC